MLRTMGRRTLARVGGSGSIALEKRTILVAAERFSTCTQPCTVPFNQNQHGFGVGSAVAALGLGLGLTTLMESKERSRAQCCGIVGIVGGAEEEDARTYLIEGLQVLKNRGYDSAGIATIGNDDDSDGDGNGNGESKLEIVDPTNPRKKIVCTKFASTGTSADSIALVTERSSGPKHHLHRVGIAHTRWATHGGKTDANAHPHFDHTGRIALVHNGTINNSTQLRKELTALGYKFRSQTDTEVLAVLIGHYKVTEKLGVREATERALGRCDGTWGLCVLDADAPDRLVVACNGSPLVIGLGEDGTSTYVASETAAFARRTRNFVPMKDGEIGVLYANSAGSSLDLEKRQQLAPHQDILLTPDPYEHWTLKECLEQPEAIGRALGFGGRLTPTEVRLGGLDAAASQLANIRSMTISACGTSLHAAKYAERLFKLLDVFDHVTAIDAAETTTRDFTYYRGGPSGASSDRDKSSTATHTQGHAHGVLVVSQSGETKDVHRVVMRAVDRGMIVLSVVNAVGSLIARTTNLGVYCNAGRENAVASTKAFTTQVTVLSLIALWFHSARNTVESTAGVALREALMRLPVAFGMGLKCRDQCRRIAATKLKDAQHCFLLGKGFGEPVALEGALKIKEMCYLHAEGYSGGALKHGPFALIEPSTETKRGTPIILIILDDEHSTHMRTAAEEVKARGADIIVVTDNRRLAEGLDDDPILVASNGPLTALGAVLPLQLLAYELSVLRGINPDTPRNLAKAVTVD